MTTETTLTEIEAAAKADIFEMLSHAPGEVEGVRQALREGRICGELYNSCFIGTIAKLRNCGIRNIPGLVPNPCRPAEEWIEYIVFDDTPQNNERARITDAWLTEWLEARGAQGEAENGQ